MPLAQPPAARFWSNGGHCPPFYDLDLVQCASQRYRTHRRVRRYAYCNAIGPATLGPRERRAGSFFTPTPGGPLGLSAALAPPVGFGTVKGAGGGYLEKTSLINVPARGPICVGGREFGDLLFTLTGVGSGLGKDRGYSVGDREGSAPDQSLKIGQGERPRLAGRMTSAQIGQLFAGRSAIFRRDPLRREHLAASLTPHLKPTRHAGSNSAKSGLEIPRRARRVRPFPASK